MVHVAPPSDEREYHVSTPCFVWVDPTAPPTHWFENGIVRKSPTVPGGPVAVSLRVSW